MLVTTWAFKGKKWTGLSGIYSQFSDKSNTNHYTKNCMYYTCIWFSDMSKTNHFTEKIVCIRQNYHSIPWSVENKMVSKNKYSKQHMWTHLIQIKCNLLSNYNANRSNCKYQFQELEAVLQYCFNR